MSQAASTGRVSGGLRAAAHEVPALLTASALALALDFAATLEYPLRTEVSSWDLSRARLYPLRTDAFLLVALDVAVLALPVSAIYAALWLWARRSPKRGLPEGRVSRAFFAALLTVAIGAVATPATSLSPGLIGVLGVTLLGALLAARLGAVGARRLAPGRRGGSGPRAVAAAAAAAAFAACVFAVILGAPLHEPAGSHLLRPPRLLPRPVASQAPNLLLVVLDTLRADRLGLYGNPRNTSPWLDEFAGRATVFEQVVAPTSYTLPSHATLFTGLYPAAHGADLAQTDAGMSLRELGRLDDFARVAPLAGEATTLAELLGGAGYETGGVCANTAYLYSAYGLGQGFATWVDAPPVETRRRPLGLDLARALGLERFWPVARALRSNERYYLLAAEVNALARAWLEPRRARRFFLFLNYMDPHEPYLPVGRYRELFPGANEPYRVAAATIRAGKRAIRADERRMLTGAYDAEVRYLDDQLRELFGMLEGFGLLEDTLVVIVGDHGESFGERARLGHAQSVYEPEVRVPLIVRTPGQRAGARVARRVHLVDVPVTILDLLGLQRPAGLHGASLFDADATRPLVAALGRYQRSYAEHAIYQGDFKLVRRSPGALELYDLRADPGETTNLAAERPELAARLARALDRYTEEMEPRFAAGRLEPDAGMAERLRALGYAK